MIRIAGICAFFLAFLALLMVSSAAAHPGNSWGANKAVAAANVKTLSFC